MVTCINLALTARIVISHQLFVKAQGRFQCAFSFMAMRWSVWNGFFFLKKKSPLFNDILKPQDTKAVATT